MTRYLIRSILIASVFLTAPVWAGPPLAVDESPASSREWGFHPADGSATRVTPPGFAWRPQKDAARYELQCARDVSFSGVEYSADDIRFSVHCPPRTLPAGKWFWRFRFYGESGDVSDWSTPRSFTIAEDARELPLPARDDLMARIPRAHPRLFIRPEQAPELRRRAQTDLKDRYDALVTECEKLLADPPPTEEPPRYPEGMKRGSDPWRDIWWGNRRYTQKALDGAATLAFTWLLGGHEAYGQLARRILMDCAKWDPRGSTGYRYNDEAGMPYAYHFSRTYTFVNDLLSEEERQTCRRMMKIRGQEMYKHLFPRHLWRPYSSHSNRAWHFLGEVGIAFLDEIEGADDWVWFAMNVFYNVYPAWSDDDGGWHEGVSYWSSYVGRFTWWADVMKAATGINAYDKPYFAKAGYYAMYLLPPGKVGGGFGDGATRRKASNVVPLVSQLAAQAGNSHWQWYVEQMGGPSQLGGYIGFLRGTLPKVQPQTPDDLPTSRHFRGIGQAALNTTLTSADDDVQVVFKSSPMGTRSHGNAANNSFVLWAYGQRLLIRSGHYYMYGGPHHRDWVWSTRSLNNITINGGQGQIKRSSAAKGRITAFKTSPSIDVVVGEAAGSYIAKKDGRNLQLLDRYTRAVLFVKPELVIVFDRLEAPQPAVFEYWLHAVNEFAIDGQRKIETRAGEVACTIDLLAPQGLKLSQTDQYDPNPWPRIKTREWHLTATTPSKTKTCEFIALLHPRRASQPPPGEAILKPIDGGYLLEAKLSDGKVRVLLPVDGSATLTAAGLTTAGEILVQRLTATGAVVETVSVNE